MRHATVPDAPLKTLGLVGDGDDIDVLEDIEDAFGLRISDEEAAGCSTVGDMYEVLLQHIVTTALVPSRCATADSFYRLRRAFLGQGIQRELAPTTRLDSLLPAFGSGFLWRRLQRESDLRMPGLCHSFPWILAAVLMFIAPLAWVVHPAEVGAWTLLFPPMAIFSDRLGPRRPPEGCTTLGDLARKTAAMNFGSLLQRCGGARSSDVWKALVLLLQPYAASKGEISRTTLFTRE